MISRPRQPKASTSSLPTKGAGSKKRSKPEREEEIIQIVESELGELAFASEDEEEEPMEDLEGESEDGEEFPEIEFDSEGEFEGEEDGSSDSDESLGLIDPDEGAALLAEIEAEDALDYSSDESADPLTTLIRDNTTKPNELDTPGTSYEDPMLLRDYMKRSKVVISEITGQEKTIWDEEIDAGYGSDSSTEEVSLFA